MTMPRRHVPQAFPPLQEEGPPSKLKWLWLEVETNCERETDVKGI